MALRCAPTLRLRFNTRGGGGQRGEAEEEAAEEEEKLLWLLCKAQ